MARAVCKVAVHGGGDADNLAYIGRPMEEPERDPDGGRGEPPGGMPEQEVLVPGGPSDDDPVWTWNAPAYVTGDCYGAAQGDPLGAALGGQDAPDLTPTHLGVRPDAGGFDFSVAEKRERAVAYFSVLADLEELRGGPTHFRIVLTVGPEATNRELKAMVNAFLGENFPLNPALIAIHRDTKFAHAHLYVHIRQIDDVRVRLGQKYFRLDESWMKVCAGRLRDAEIYRKHIDLKAETLEWKARAAQAREKGGAIPSKPDRWADHHDTLLVFRPFNDRWCGRLRAQTRVAEARVRWHEATKARPEQVATAREEARNLRTRLGEATERRGKSKSESKRAMPAEIITVSEARDLLLYERDIRRAAKGKGGRPTLTAPELPPGQGALRFDGPAAGPGGQLGFDFVAPAERPPATDSAQHHTRPGPKPAAVEHGRAETPASGTTRVPTPTGGAARSFGLELIAEVKLAHTEYSLSEEKSAKERRRLKERLIEDRREHARAARAAAAHRSLLSEEGADEPPYMLKDEERGYLKFMSGGVSGRLRERIEAQVARAEIISHQEEEVLTRGPQEHEQAAGVAPPAPEEGEPALRAVGGRPAVVAASAKRGEPATEVTRPSEPALTRPAEATGEAAARTLPDEEVMRLTVQYEVAKARAAVLRVVEEDFKAAPHHWTSPKYKLSLAGIEEKVALGIKEGENVSWLHEARERVREELAAERVRSPLRRQNAEREAQSIEERLRVEAAARAEPGLEMPDATPSAEDLRELLECAEAARDARLLRRVFEIERGEALREAKERGNGEPVLLLEERYAGVQLMADVRADRSGVALDRATRGPDKTLLSAQDKSGRDFVATFEQVASRKGIKGAFGRLFEPESRRSLRGQLTETKVAYLDHLRADSEGRRAFHEAARQIARECRELGRKFGHLTPAMPALSEEKIREARDHAVTRTGSARDGWLTACTQSQKLKDERELDAVVAARAAKSVELFLPRAQTGEKRSEQDRRETVVSYERTPVGGDQRLISPVIDPRQVTQPKDPAKDLSKPDKGGGGVRGR